jgi:hypothetical protein
MLKINTKVAAAVTSALALGGFATQASAAYVEPWNVTGTETFTVRLSGATAQDKGIVLLMRRICALGTMTRVTSGLQSVNICQADGTGSAPIAAGTTLVLYKNSVSGSGSGVNPVADKTTIPFLNLASLTQAQYTTPGTCTYSTTASTVDFADFQSYDCGTNAGVTNIAPDAGISDVEPALLGWVSGVNGAIDTFAGPQVIFGVPVSKNFRDALQTAQSSNLGGACVGSDSEACMPSLTFGQISSIYSGAMVTVNRLSDDAGVVIPNPAGSSAFEVCRRKNGSGTLASYRAYFLNEGCAKGVKGMVAGSDGDLSYAALPAGRIAEYGGTDRVIGCLNASHAVSKYAIGMASMENKPGSAYANTGRAAPFDNDTGNWGWVKINGYAPTLLNVAQSRYSFLYEATYQHRKAGNPGGALTGDPKTFFDLIVATNASAAVIKELNNAFIESSGSTLWYSGLIGRPTTPTAPSAAPAGKLTVAEVVANPVNTWTRAATGAPNSCNFPYISKETGLDMLQ